jgi:hypothetical protein
MKNWAIVGIKSSKDVIEALLWRYTPTIFETIVDDETNESRQIEIQLESIDATEWVNIPLDLNAIFIDRTQLTEEIMLSWLFNQLGAEKVSQIENGIIT